MAIIYGNDFEAVADGAVAGWSGFSSPTGGTVGSWVAGGAGSTPAIAPIHGSKSYGQPNALDAQVTLNTSAGAIADCSLVFSQRMNLSAGNFSIAGVCVRSNGTNAGYFFTPNPSNNAIQILNMNGYAGLFSSTSLSAYLGRAIVDADLLWMRVEPQGTAMRARAWFDGGAEPGTWLVNTTLSNYASGNFGFRVSSNLAGRTVVIDDLMVTDFEAVSINPATAPASRLPVSVALTGVGTAWTGSTVFSVTGGTGAQVVGQAVVSGTTAVIALVPGTAAATLTISDGANSTTFAVTAAVPVYVAPNSASVQFYGMWNIQPTRATSINSGGVLEFEYTGDTCKVGFDLSGVQYGPEVVTEVDGGAPVRTAISPTIPTISLAPAYNSGTNPAALAHKAILWLEGVYEGLDAGGTQATVNQWTNLQAAASLIGIELGSGQAPLPIPAVLNLIEIDGDSIAASVRTKYAGSGASNQTVMASRMAWPQQVADLLGMRPIVRGFGGQGITTAGSGGVPVANSAYGFIYNGVAYNPTTKPYVICVYMGTNDTTFTQAQYQTYLSTIRAANPNSYIFAIVPYNKASLAAPIQAAVLALDAHIYFLDYSSGVYGPTDTTDGIHPGPGGHAKLAARLASDIRAQLPLVMQATSMMGSATPKWTPSQFPIFRGGWR